MKRIKHLLSRIRLVYRRSSILVKCMILAAVVLSTVALLVLRGAMLQTQSRTDGLRGEAAALEAENRQLKQSIGLQNTVDGILKIAREKLGLVDPDTVIFEPEQD